MKGHQNIFVCSTCSVLRERLGISVSGGTDRAQQMVVAVRGLETSNGSEKNLGVRNAASKLVGICRHRNMKSFE
jgi:hypothetical protein